MTMLKLPKQWKHWCKLARITPDTQKGRWSSFYLKGRNRHWRVDCLGNFECSCPNENFDRWANSRGAEVSAIPKSEQEFLSDVAFLLDQSKDAK